MGRRYGDIVMIKLARNHWASGALVTGIGLLGCSVQEDAEVSQKEQAASLAVSSPDGNTANLPSRGNKVRPDSQVDATKTQDGRRRVWVMLKSPTSLSAVKGQGWKAQGQAVHKSLTTAATASQASLKGWLKARKIDHQSFWAVNTILVVADDATVDEIKKRPDVQRVIDGFRGFVPQPNPSAVQRAVEEVEWNIAQVRAPEAWSDFGVRGEGVVVANIDTGVEYTHPALASSYRGMQSDGSVVHDYNWHDPSAVCGDPSAGPCDNAGHGTHTMGTIVGDDGGDNQIGMAPGATWIAAKGCEDWSCSDVALLSSAQWILAPTDITGQNPRSDLRPHIVSNSWGGGSGDSWYQEMVQAWIAAGIFPVFSNGNSGDSCGSANSPGDYPESYGVGAYDINSEIAWFSSRGESAFGVTKPNLSAPGVDVRSAVPGGYDWYSGTSMAAPHVAGAVALLWSAAPALLEDIESTREILDTSAIDHEDLTCGGTPENNNVWGQGSLDVYEALSIAPIGPTGWLSGSVTTPDGDVIQGAAVSVVGPQARKTSSNSEGFYSLRLPVGNYSLTASAFGYLGVTADDLVIVDTQTTEHSIVMEAAPSFQLSGIVTDAEGSPIFGAEVKLLGTPLPSSITDAEGHFDFGQVPQGTYSLSTSASGCYAPELLEITLESPTSLETDLEPVVDGYGYQCRPVATEYIAAEESIGLMGDDSTAIVTLPFPVTFYGHSYSSISVDTNGLVSFVASFSNYVNQPVPSMEQPNAAIFGFWDDLYVEDPSQILVSTVGEAPERKFVIEWRGVPFLDGSGYVNFEIVLREQGGIVVQYGDLASPTEKGLSATLGIEDEGGKVGLQYSYNQASVTSNSAILYEVPHSGFIEGAVIDANDQLPIPGVSVSVLDSQGRERKAAADSSGNYRLELTEGLYALTAGSGNYETATASVVVIEDETVRQDFSLRSARVELTPRTLQLLVPAGELRSRTLVLGNTGSIPLEYSISEAGGRKQSSLVTKSRPRKSGGNALARDTKTLFETVKGSVTPMTPGDILFSFPATGMSLGWGIGQASNVWLSDLNNRQNFEFSQLGAPTGLVFDATSIGEWPGDMAFDTTHDLMCQVAVGGDNGIHCWDQNSGAEQAVIAGNFPWTGISQRGLAYKADDDSFFIGGWNEGIIYHVQGLDGDSPGEVLSSCAMADGSISGLAYNPVSDSLWVATNSPEDLIYQINPYDCTVLSYLPAVSGSGYEGAGLDLDPEGNLWTFAQGSQQAILVESGVPLFSDVPWLSVAPSEGTLNVGDLESLEVVVDTTGLTPGLYLATLFVQTNAGREKNIKIPVSLVVSDYFQGINAGSTKYVDALGDTWARPKAYRAGKWGYLQAGTDRSTNREIEGTFDQPLYQTQQEDPYAYRFDAIPNGVYEVDLGFAELQKNVGPGKRLFDVIIEDTLVLPAHDITFEVGHFAAESRTFFVPVTDGRLDVRFVPRAGSKKPVINSLRAVHRPDR